MSQFFIPILVTRSLLKIRKRETIEKIFLFNKQILDSKEVNRGENIFFFHWLCRVQSNNGQIYSEICQMGQTNDVIIAWLCSPRTVGVMLLTDD